MSTTSRPPPQAKYELLGYHERTSAAKRAVVAGILFIVLVGITIMTMYLGWTAIKTAKHSGFLPIVNMEDSAQGLKDMHQKRLDVYEKAFKELDSGNTSALELFMPNLTSSNAKKGPKSELPKLVCYYGLDEAHDLRPEAVEPDLCTHIIIASMGVVNKTLSTLSPSGMKVLHQILALKLLNPALKVMMCIGGFSYPGGYNDMVKTYDSRKRFISDVLLFLTSSALDGVDLDWEFPAWESAAMERVYFSLLLKELREEMEKKKTELILSVAVAAPKPVIEVAYDVPQMMMYVDFINLMAYDYHFFVPYWRTTGANAPLYRRPDEHGFFTTLNTNWSAYYWLEKGMPKNKIVVGIPSYGHSFKLLNAANHGWDAPSTGFGSVGQAGFVTYPEVCKFKSLPGALDIFDNNSQVPYTYCGLEWISYDDDRSVAYKAQYIVNNDFAGAMVFSLNQDDFEGICSGTRFAVTRQVKIVLMDDRIYTDKPFILNQQNKTVLVDEQLQQVEKGLSIALGIF